MVGKPEFACLGGALPSPMPCGLHPMGVGRGAAVNNLGLVGGGHHIACK